MSKNFNAKVFVFCPFFCNFAAVNHTLNVGGRLIELSSPIVMGILNATPDSFFAGSRRQTDREIAIRAQQIVAEGGVIIDVGGYSTRPGAGEVSVEEELRRLQLALEVVHREVPEAIISVDTFRPEVARRCVEQWGAHIVNDVLPSEEMFREVARLGVPYVLTSRAATTTEMLRALARDVNMLHSLGQKDIIIDPGFGFGKTVEENYDIMARLEQLQCLEQPVLVGVSRKSMIWKTLGTTPDEALTGTIALHAVALQKGASILRVHDVHEAVETIRIMEKLKH